ncbi:MFS transporter [Nosocomiicoccus sp. HMSC09A07]|uniref:MFS transporter n=1 Tax=Nosocomiicoccus sp. HMSC09A07 TaxID=1581145 RepID=UPI0008A45346|nr:MFS transporter [Nosocomiicoccus sp. HMSC09A07]OFS61835.1 hypothetical protein HMPREF3177_07245 [Nosocomiicoccus sp. HMSC09A07]
MGIIFRNKLFSFIMISNVFGILGTTLFNIVFIIYAQNFPNPELAVSSIIIVSTIPFVIDFIFGYLSDKTHKKVEALLCSRLIQVVLFVIFSVVVNFNASWLIFGLILLINFISDIIGVYNTYIELPIVKSIVPKKDLTNARSIQSGVLNSIHLLGSLVGVSFISLINYNYYLFGIFNSLIFIISFIILYFLKDNINKGLHFKNADNKNNYDNVKISLKKDLKSKINILLSFETITKFTILFLLLNFISSGQYSILILTFLENESLTFKNFGYTVALFEVIESVGMILGALIPIKFLRRKSIESNILITIIITLFIILCIILYPHKYILLILTFFSGYFVGLSNPRIDSYIMIVVPEDSLGSVMSLFYSVIQIAVPIGTTVFLFFANKISLNIAWILLLFVTLTTLLYTTYMFLKNKTIPENI